MISLRRSTRSSQRYSDPEEGLRADHTKGYHCVLAPFCGVRMRVHLNKGESLWERTGSKRAQPR